MAQFNGPTPQFTEIPGSKPDWMSNFLAMSTSFLGDKAREKKADAQMARKENLAIMQGFANQGRLQKTTAKDKAGTKVGTDFWKVTPKQETSTDVKNKMQAKKIQFELSQEGRDASFLNDFMADPNMIAMYGDPDIEGYEPGKLQAMAETALNAKKGARDSLRFAQLENAFRAAPDPVSRKKVLATALRKQFPDTNQYPTPVIVQMVNEIMQQAQNSDDLYNDLVGRGAFSPSQTRTK